MNPDTWRQVERLYHEALERPAAERAAFLDAACSGDEAIRRELDRLIAAHDQAGTFLDAPAWDVAPEGLDADHDSALVGRSIGAYKVLSSLGRGGMGEVYLAEDTRLGRQIALKLLPARFTQDAERIRRFEQEVRAASALNHPNIITVYDIGETEAGRFIVMEVVAGRTLRALAANSVSPAVVARIGRQIAEALAVAHAAGIVHRDIKPENVMVRDDGYVKVLDFGLARLVSARTALAGREVGRDTRPGILLGTMRYMSPEQARGEPVGTSTDIFSLGIVLYELATGLHPFHEDSQVGVLHGIVSAPPRPAKDVSPAIPERLNELILQMLDKTAARRPTAAAVAVALNAQAASDVTPARESGPAPEAPRAPSGRRSRRLGSVTAVAALLVASLAGLSWLLGLPSRTDPESAPPASTPAATDRRAERPRVSTGGPASANVEANRYFENAMQSKIVNDLTRARLMLERALALDAAFAEARAWYGFTNWLMLDQGYSNDSSLLYRAEEEARRALADEPALARAHVVYGSVYLMQGRKELVPAEIQRAMASHPGDEDASQVLMIYHQYNDDFAAARRVGQEVLDRLPLFFPNRMVLGEILRQSGDLAGAVREQERILEQDPQSVYALNYLARTYLDAGDLVRSRQTLDQISGPDARSFRTRRSRALLLALEGKPDEALAMMDGDVQKWQALVAYETSEAADFFAVLGETATALDWLDRAVRYGDERVEWFRRDPLLAAVRDHPRFQEILASIGYRRQQRKPPA